MRFEFYLAFDLEFGFHFVSFLSFSFSFTEIQLFLLHLDNVIFYCNFPVNVSFSTASPLMKTIDRFFMVYLVRFGWARLGCRRLTAWWNLSCFDFKLLAHTNWPFCMIPFNIFIFIWFLHFHCHVLCGVWGLCFCFISESYHLNISWIIWGKKSQFFFFLALCSFVPSSVRLRIDSVDCATVCACVCVFVQ